MPQTIKPATPLPWTQLPYKFGGRSVAQRDQDDAYELHAANAYHKLVDDRAKLVEALRNVLSRHPAWSQIELIAEARSLLRSLGEAE